MQTPLHDKRHLQAHISGFGTIQGAVDERNPQVARFMNVPFGTVVQRWKPAAQPEPWSGVRDATKQGPMPPQEIIEGPSPFLLETLETVIGPFEDLYDERDCLNLNIFMPTNSFSSVTSQESLDLSLLPVLVWIYGGALRRGGNGIALFDATNFVAESIALGRPIVVVVPNYRVNYLGFLASKELRSIAAPGESVGNWGLLDQIMALEWVRNQIHLFSGDKDKVTIAGESSGAVSTNTLMNIERAHGLFQRAILQSGSMGMISPSYADQDGQLYINHLFQKFGISDEDPDHVKIEKLRQVPAKSLAEELKTYEVTFFRPSIDGVLINGDIRHGLSSGYPKLYPKLQWVLAGSCRDEDTFDRLYGVPSSDTIASEISVQLINDGVFRYPLYQAAQAIFDHNDSLLQSSSDTVRCSLSRFHFDCTFSKISEENPTFGAHHGSDIMFMFGADLALKHMTEQEKQLSKSMQSTWIEFITAKDPSTSHIPKVNRSALPQDQHSEGEAILFREDWIVSRTNDVERLSKEKTSFWKKANEYYALEAAKGRSADVGFNLFQVLA
ncbi:hypothetical protein BGW38_002759 [Lunasporangiospora selenospora]|uniref:Carboxylesterase type B domain-containing protein n=1 Tax=Lunasporangiospora selenospora TaxID=979761 RepID=A0A9P6KJ91_9FUNG|nr:hypothetical protein BGW38_002759 [Lunasporangiospora selenospora]